MKQRLSMLSMNGSMFSSSSSTSGDKTPMPEPMAPLPEDLGASSTSSASAASASSGGVTPTPMSIGVGSSSIKTRGSGLGSGVQGAVSPKMNTLKSRNKSVTEMMGGLAVASSGSGVFGGGINEKLIILRSGYLKKKGVINTGWKKRWFLLTDKQLAYYDDEPEDLETEEPKGFIALALITKVEHHSDKSNEDFMFDVITPARVYRLQAESISEMEAWIATISGTAANAQQHSRRRGTQGIIRDMTEDTALQGEDISAAFGGPHQPADLRKWELWNAYDVSAWLQTFGMGKHRKKFYAAGITGAHLKGLSSESLAQLGVTEKTEQIKILSSVQRLISGGA